MMSNVMIDTLIDLVNSSTLDLIIITVSIQGVVVLIFVHLFEYT